MSCIVQITGLPRFSIFLTPFKDTIPWVTQFRRIASASFTRGCFHSGSPSCAVSILKRVALLKPLAKNILSRSRRNLYLIKNGEAAKCTKGDWESFSQTSIFAWCPSFKKASMSRRDTTAAPPVESLLLIITIFIK